jgi:hypothetical protein
MSRRARPTTCKIRRCTGAYYARNLCERHWAKERRLRKARGLLDRVPAAPVVAHLEVLRRRGWTWHGITAATGVSSWLIGRLQRGEVTTLQREKADRFLAVDPVWQETAVSVPVLGTRRRLASLAWQGWSGREVARRLGMSEWMFTNGIYRGSVEARVAAAVARFYDEHADQPGPNPAYAKKARTQGAIPPAAWEGDLDDPATRPVGVRKRPGLAALDLAEVDELLAAGLSVEDVAARVGRKPKSIERARIRAAKRATEQSGEAA